MSSSWDSCSIMSSLRLDTGRRFDPEGQIHEDLLPKLQCRSPCSQHQDLNPSPPKVPKGHCQPGNPRLDNLPKVPKGHCRIGNQRLLRYQNITRIRLSGVTFPGPVLQWHLHWLKWQPRLPRSRIRTAVAGNPLSMSLWQARFTTSSWPITHWRLAFPRWNQSSPRLTHA